jgi:hypothetical protein
VKASQPRETTSARSEIPCFHVEDHRIFWITVNASTNTKPTAIQIMTHLSAHDPSASRRRPGAAALNLGTPPTIV